MMCCVCCVSAAKGVLCGPHPWLSEFLSGRGWGNRGGSRGRELCDLGELLYSVHRIAPEVGAFVYCVQLL